MQIHKPSTTNQKKNKFSERYTIGKKIAQGGFGKIYVAHDKFLNQTVAIKTEGFNATHPMLDNETSILKTLSGVSGIPEVIDSFDFKKYKILVMPLYGYSLAHLRHYLGGKFSLFTTAIIGIQAISRLKEIHAKGYIHRDIKPHNFVISQEDPTKLYLIDFGLSKRFRSKETGEHIPLIKYSKVVGTAKYISIYAHSG